MVYDIAFCNFLYNENQPRFEDYFVQAFFPHSFPFSFHRRNQDWISNQCSILQKLIIRKMYRAKHIILMERRFFMGYKIEHWSAGLVSNNDIKYSDARQHVYILEIFETNKNVPIYSIVILSDTRISRKSFYFVWINIFFFQYVEFCRRIDVPDTWCILLGHSRFIVLENFHCKSPQGMRARGDV